MDKVRSEDAVSAIQTLKNYCKNWQECNKKCIFYDDDYDEYCSLLKKAPDCWEYDIIIVNKEGWLRDKINDVLQNYSNTEIAINKIIEQVNEVYKEELNR